MRVYFIFDIKDEFKKLYFGHENKLYSILKSIYHLSKEEIDYGYSLLNQITIPMDKERINRDLFVKLHREVPYSLRDGVHYYNQLYKDEVSRLVVGRFFIKIEVDQKSSSFFTELKRFSNNLFVCDFYTTNYFYIS